MLRFQDRIVPCLQAKVMSY